MAVLTIRDLDDAAKVALKQRAAINGRSMEAEARQAIYAYVGTQPKKRDLSKIVPFLPPAPADLDWFAVDEEELPDWERE